jgi:hypothetical protein
MCILRTGEKGKPGSDLRPISRAPSLNSPNRLTLRLLCADSVLLSKCFADISSGRTSPLVDTSIPPRRGGIAEAYIQTLCPIGTWASLDQRNNVKVGKLEGTESCKRGQRWESGLPLCSCALCIES